MIQRKDNWTRTRGEANPPQKASASSRGVASLLWKSNFQGYLLVHAWLRNRVGWVGLLNYKPSESFLNLAFPIVSQKRYMRGNTSEAEAGPYPIELPPQIACGFGRTVLGRSPDSTICLRPRRRMDGANGRLSREMVPTDGEGIWNTCMSHLFTIYI